MRLLAMLTRASAAVAVIGSAIVCRSVDARPGISASDRADSLAIRRDISYLSSDALEGRGTGTPGNDSAAAYIARRYAMLGLAPAIGPASACAAIESAA